MNQDGLGIAGLFQPRTSEAEMSPAIFGLEDKSRQSVKFPRAVGHGDVHRVPSRIVTPPESASRLLARIGEDGHRVGMELPFGTFVILLAKNVGRGKAVDGGHFSHRMVLENLIADATITISLCVLGDGFLRSTGLVIGGQDRVTQIEGIAITLAHLLPDFQHQRFLQGVEKLLLVGGVLHILHLILQDQTGLVDAIALENGIEVDDVDLCFRADDYHQQKQG